MLRDASQRTWAAEASAPASRCDAPQHEGEGAPRILAKRIQRVFCPSVSSPRKRGPMITAGGYGSRLSACFRGRRPGRRSVGRGEAPTYGCAKSGPTEFHCFRPVINNDFCNSNVLGHRGLCVTPYVIPDVSPSIVIPCAIIRRHPMCHYPSHVSLSVVIMCFAFEAPMPTRRIHIEVLNPPPGPRPR
jgi:hypothetical protein